MARKDVPSGNPRKTDTPISVDFVSNPPPRFLNVDSSRLRFAKDDYPQIFDESHRLLIGRIVPETGGGSAVYPQGYIKVFGHQMVFIPVDEDPAKNIEIRPNQEHVLPTEDGCLMLKYLIRENIRYGRSEAGDFEVILKEGAGRSITFVLIVEEDPAVAEWKNPTEKTDHDSDTIALSKRQLAFSLLGALAIGAGSGLAAGLALSDCGATENAGENPVTEESE